MNVGSHSIFDEKYCCGRFTWKNYNYIIDSLNFSKTKLDPTIINGGVINSIQNTAKLGKSDWSILEADESDGSFIHIPPTYSIITNIDRAHGFL